MFDSCHDCRYRCRAHRSVRTSLRKVTSHTKPGTRPLGSAACPSFLFTQVRGRGVLGSSYGVPQAQGMRPEAQVCSRPNSGHKPNATRQTGGTRIALILFVEYHAAFRQSVSYLMDQEDDLKVVAQAGSVAEGREGWPRGA